MTASGAGVSVLGGAAIVVSAYLLGSVPFSYLIVKLAKGRDVRTVALGSGAGVGCFPVLLLAGERLGWLRPAGAGPVAAAFAIAALILFKHRANLDRLRRGVEPRLGERRGVPAPPQPPAGGSR